jgi:uncharacterized circularly permuted ATP-grasp superfamily protein
MFPVDDVGMNQTTQVLSHPPASLFQDYALPAEGYDEAFGAVGQPRPHWQEVVRLLDTCGPAELGRRWTQARQMLYEHGVTFNPDSDSQHLDQPWELDVIPLVLAAAEWQTLEAGLLQRVRLLNTLLADIYGPQTLMQTGILPPELVFAQAGFLRPCHQVAVPGGRYLYLYAADLRVPRMGSGTSWRITHKIRSGWGMPFHSDPDFSMQLPRSRRALPPVPALSASPFPACPADSRAYAGCA